jgi:hypothetical protein
VRRQGQVAQIAPAAYRAADVGDTQRKKPRRSGAVVLGMAKPDQKRAASTR